MAVGQLGVNFIGQHQHIGLPQHLRDELQLLFAHHRARGIAGERQDQQFRAGVMAARSSSAVSLNPFFRFQRQSTAAAGQRCDGIIAHKAGFGNDDLVPGFHQRADAHVNGFRTRPQ